MMSSDEDDYMSDKFLSESNNLKRPGLISNRAKEREIEVQTKRSKLIKEQKHTSKSNKNIEKERLQEGLNNALTSENKGFALLCKMGYKQGQSLGKNSSGIVEPIGIQLKADRSGLGREQALLELKQKINYFRKKKLEAKDKSSHASIEEFRKRMTKKSEERCMEIDLRKCQKACEKLDERNNIEVPPMKWFWPEYTAAETEDAEDEDESVDDEEYEITEKLEMITSYLRMSYNYCHWCATQYNDEHDLIENCPGLGKDDH